MKVLVAYESRGGRTKRAAEAIADAVRTSGLEADVWPLKEAEPDQVRAADVLFVGVPCRTSARPACPCWWCSSRVSSSARARSGSKRRQTIAAKQESQYHCHG